MFESMLDGEHTFGQHGAMHRTYVRRRLALAAVGATLVLALVAPSVASASGPDLGAGARASERTYVVTSGDTVWAIASRVAEGRDPREVVDAIMERNGLRDGTIVPGQALAIPSFG
jgi:LysM repeat protein